MHRLARYHLCAGMMPGLEINRLHTAVRVSGQGQGLPEVLRPSHLSFCALVQPLLFCSACSLDSLNLLQSESPH